jgi:hypothetical protein
VGCDAAVFRVQVYENGNRYLTVRSRT